MNFYKINFKYKDLINRLIPKQQILSKPITLNSSLGKNRPLTTKQNNRITTHLPPIISIPKTPKKRDIINEDLKICSKNFINPLDFINYAKINNLITEYVYLIKNNQIEDIDNPTKLKITNQDTSLEFEFWTLSLKGLAHVKGSEVEFIPLNEWLKSIDSFSKIIQSPFFKYQRFWRFFRLWKSIVQRSKLSLAKSSLSQDLCFAHKVLRPSFLNIQRKLNELNEIKLFSLKSDGIFSIDEFVQDNMKHKDIITKQFEDFHHFLLKSVQDACEMTRDVLDSPERENISKNTSPLEALIDHYNKSKSSGYN